MQGSAAAERLIAETRGWPPRLAVEVEEVPVVSLAEIVERLDQISQVWRSDTPAEQRLDLVDLDDLLEQLDGVEQETLGATEKD